MLITRDDLQRRFLTQHSITALLQHCFAWLQHVVPTLQRCVALKIVVANRLVWHHLQTLLPQRAWCTNRGFAIAKNTCYGRCCKGCIVLIAAFCWYKYCIRSSKSHCTKSKNFILKGVVMQLSSDCWRRNPLGNWVILISRGRKPCTSII